MVPQVRNVQIIAAWAKVLQGHGTETIITGTMWKEMFLIATILYVLCGLQEGIWLYLPR